MTATVDFHVGQYVTPLGGEEYVYSNGFTRVYASHKLRITRVYTNSLQIRDETDDVAFTLNRNLVRLVDNVPSDWTDKFKIPGEETIAPNDPRLAYLWRAAAALADEAGHCSVYDDLASQLGIPGRERIFVVGFQIEGMEAEVDGEENFMYVRANNEASAETKVRELVRATLTAVNVSEY